MLLSVFENGEQLNIGDRGSNSGTLYSFVFGVLTSLFEISFGQNI
jgi:hypothetical protein